MSTPVSHADDVLINYGILKATKLTPHYSTASIEELLIGFITQQEEGVTPDMTVEIGVIPGDNKVLSARVLDPERNCKASWRRRDPDEQPEEWVTVVTPSCWAALSHLSLKAGKVRRDIRGWEHHRTRQGISRPLAFVA
jgi:hypothetical protein